MKIPVMNNCCCQCTLEVGSKIFALWQVFAGIMRIVIAIDEDFKNNEELAIFVVELIFAFTDIGMGILLIYAIKKRKAKIIQMWVVMSIMIFGFFFIHILINCVVSIINKEVDPFDLLLDLLFLVLDVYFIIIVANFRREILESADLSSVAYLTLASPSAVDHDISPLHI